MKMKIVFIVLFYFITTLSKSQSNCVNIVDSTTLLSNINHSLEDFTFRLLNPNCNVSIAIRNLLITRLTSPPFTFEQIDSVLKKENGQQPFGYTYSDVHKRFAKGNDSLSLIIFDSLAHAQKMASYNQQKKLPNNYRFGVDKDIILSTGWLYLQKAKPILQNALKDVNYKYEPVFVKLALARMGDKESINYCLQNISENISQISTMDNWDEAYQKSAPYMIFPAQQETIYEMHNWLDSSRRDYSNPSPSGKSRWFFSSYKPIVDLKVIILNKDFQKIVKSVELYEEEFSLQDKSIVQQCKEWLINNKGNYKINPYYCPYIK